MAHKAGAEFFKTKRHWSERKDLILSYYLTPYLPKIATQKKPVCIVDGFAGPGRFDDGKPGSPVLILARIREWLPKSPVPVEAVFIERDSILFRRLQEVTQSITFARCINSSFLEAVPEIIARSKTHSVLLYLDPFSVDGLEWESIDRVFAALKCGQSVELLLNFNVVSFVRRGLAALRLAQPTVEESGPESDDFDSQAVTPLETLDRMIGGVWWREILGQTSPFAKKVEQVTDAFCRQLKARFNEVCTYSVRGSHRHVVPKYTLVFASRHPDALELMNDAMCKAREMDASAASSGPTLFQLLPESLVPDAAKLPEAILTTLGAKRLKRANLVHSVMRANFCKYSGSEIRKGIGALLKSNKLESSTGQFRINDDVEVSLHR